MSSSHVKKDKRLYAIAALVFGCALVAYLVTLLPARGVDAQRLSSQRLAGFSGVPDSGFVSVLAQIPVAEVALPPPASEDEIRAHGALRAANEYLKQEKPEPAIRALDDARAVLINMPEAYLMLGQALESRGDALTARDFYLAAIARNPYLYDAHWGVATTSEKLGELDAAVGAMRSYLHTETDPAPDRLRVNQARSAIWEWEAQLGRGEWGPTRGVPPDFTAEQIRRDGRGVGVKMQKPETLRPDGTWEFEIKSSEKRQIYPRP